MGFATLANMLSIELLSSNLSSSLRTWVFDKEASGISVGRCSSNLVVIRNKFVSRHHLFLEAVDGVWHLQNLGKNGCYLNGQRISTATLSSSTFVRLGRVGPYLRLKVSVLSPDLWESSLAREPLAARVTELSAGVCTVRSLSSS